MMVEVEAEQEGAVSDVEKEGECRRLEGIHWEGSPRLYGVTYQKAAVFIINALRT
jgi:hypothetical protein